MGGTLMGNPPRYHLTMEEVLDCHLASMCSQEIPVSTADTIRALRIALPGSLFSDAELTQCIVTYAAQHMLAVCFDGNEQLNKGP
jgi:hypothetical protein